jgi:thiamine phosphate synthase YjbQ (UPF0047 family)
MHITGSVFINDDESGLHHDYEVWLERLPPPHAPQHNRTAEDNADAHLKRQIMGREVVVTGAASGWASGWMAARRVTSTVRELLDILIIP